MDDIGARVAALLGGQFGAWHRVPRGYTPAMRGVIELTDGRTAFAKAGTREDTAAWLRTEARVYGDVLAPFMPQMFAFEDGEVPVLVLEDLRRAHWPPPWRSDDVTQTLVTLKELAKVRAPAWVPLLEDQRDDLAGWSKVAEDRAPFLSLGLCSEEWIEGALPALVQAEAAANLAGDALLHMDVRSDNMCFIRRRCLLIDWNLVCRGDPRFDLAFWLPSLASEGGPKPEELMPDAPEYAAIVSGFFAARAGLPVIPHAPRVREVQRSQLAEALPWAVRALGLPEPSGAQSNS